MTDFDFTFSISASDLAEQIAESGLDHDQMFDLITLLDAQIADWDFTIRLRDYLTADIPKDVQDDYDQQCREAEEASRLKAEQEAQPWVLVYDEKGTPFLRNPVPGKADLPFAFFDFTRNL